jgi:alpha-tubulin suppressor-like RCC1 family protein
VGGGNGDLIPSPQKHGSKVQGIGSLIAGEGHVLTPGHHYRVHIYRANGTDKFADFVAGIGIASLALPNTAQTSGVTGRSLAVAGGSAHSVTLNDDGTVWTWGANYSGQLGNGTTADSAVPQQVPGLTGIVAVAAGEAHTLALTAAGTVWAWGDNSHGQLGTGSTINSLIPVQIPELVDVASISAGRLHSMAMKNDGSMWAWGANYNGQLGDGTVANSSVPIKVMMP